MYDVIIIGAGAVGAFLARNLSRYDLRVLVLEKENDVGDVTSMANSAIVHSGYDPIPGSKKAYFNVRGNAMYPTLCKELSVEFEQIGSMTIALEEGQFETLKQLQERAKQNGVETEILSAERCLELEPNLNKEVKGALLCPSAGIVNPFTLVAHAFENAIDNGGVELHLVEEVLGIEPEENGNFKVTTSKAEYLTRMVADCAGLQSAKIHALIEDIEYRIIPRKGQYFVLDHYAPGLVNHTLFPLPSAKGKGVLVTPTTSGNYLVGPSAEECSDNDFSTDSVTLEAVKQMALELVPGIPFREQIRTFAGIRATPSTHDFIIEASKTYPNFILCAGIESPGLVSSPAIGEYVCEELIVPYLKPSKKERWNPCVKPYYRPVMMEEKERRELIAKDPNYGIVCCNCEKVTLGELYDTLSRSVPCFTIKALRKRARAGFGRCQSGFCQPKILMLLAKYLHVSPLEILYDKEGSNVLKKESK